MYSETKKNIENSDIAISSAGDVDAADRADAEDARERAPAAPCVLRSMSTKATISDDGDRDQDRASRAEAQPALLALTSE